MYKKCLVVLICLLMFGNSAHGAVLCFGTDGHIEIESAFHEQCDERTHSQPTDPKQLPYQSDHAKDRHCEPCVDVPISIDLAKITRVYKQSNFTFQTPATNEIVLADKFDLSAHNSALSPLDATSFFSPLRTVILLI